MNLFLYQFKKAEKLLWQLTKFGKWKIFTEFFVSVNKFPKVRSKQTNKKREFPVFELPLVNSRAQVMNCDLESTLKHKQNGADL